MPINRRALRIAVLGLSVVGFSIAAFLLLHRRIHKPNQTIPSKTKKPAARMPRKRINRKRPLADRDLAKKIRRSIASDSSLSTYAHNIKVIVRDGVVTLKGPVHTEDEKNAIGVKASEIAGADKVQNELVVKS